MVEERYPDLNEMDDIRFDEIWEDHWRNSVEESNDKKKICALRWCVYVKEKEELITRSFSVSVPHPKGGKMFWTCVKDHIIEEKDNYKEIRLRGFKYTLFEEEEGRGKLEGLERYPYLKHLIKFWPGDWEKHMEKIEVVTMKNRVTLNGGGKRQIKKFTRQEFWKCIVCILLAVTYGKKGRKLWSEVSNGFGKYDNLTLRRDVRGTTKLHKVCSLSSFVHLCF